MEDMLHQLQSILLQIPRRKNCGHCNGTGWIGSIIDQPCQHCNGTGWVYALSQAQMIDVTKKAMKIIDDFHYS